MTSQNTRDKELIAKAESLATRGLTPIISAAISISLIAIQLLPILPLVRFLATQANKKTNRKQKRYLAAGVDSEPVIKKLPTLLLGAVIIPVAE